MYYYRVTIYNDDAATIIHEPSVDPADPHLYSCTLTEGQSGEIDSLQFTILPNNPGYELLNSRTTLIEVTRIWVDDGTLAILGEMILGQAILGRGEEEIVFSGRVLTMTPEMEENGLIYKSIVCESRLGYLCDSIQPYLAKDTYWDDGERTGIEQYLDLVLENHNAQVEDYKKIYRGNVTFATSTGNVTKGLTYESTWSTINGKVLDDLGGEMQLREDDDGLLYLDYVDELGSTMESPTIEIARNMRSISCEIDPTSVITRLIPLGANLGTVTTETETEDDTTTETEDGDYLTIAEVNDGVIYLDDADAQEKYGIVEGTVQWSDVTQADNLLRKAKEWLASQSFTDSVTLSAVDLNLIGIDANTVERYNYYRVINDRIGLDDYLRVIKKTTNICDPSDITYELGGRKHTLSGTLAEATKDVDNTYKALQTTSTTFQIKEAALYTEIENATATIKSDIAAEYVKIVEQTDADGNVVAGYSTTGDIYNAITQTVSESENTILSEISAKYVTTDTLDTITNDMITGTVTEYYQSTSATELSGGAWSTTSPTWTEGTYIWVRTTVTTGTGDSATTTTSEAVCITGNTGAQGEQGEQGEKGEQGEQGIQGLQGIQGEQGEQGIQGEAGEDGKTSYFHIKYSEVESPTASDMTETPSTYIGTYVDYTETDSTDPADYTWVKWIGEDGAQGIAGTNGTDGKTYYLHIAYANSEDGKTDFSVSDSTDKSYIGQYTDTEEDDSTDYTKYAWTKIKGEDGADGADGKDGTDGADGKDGSDGADGADGISVESIVAYYAVSESATYYPSHGDDGTTSILGTAVLGTMILGNSGTWYTTQPTVGNTEYLWVCFLISYSNGVTSWTEPYCMTDPSTREAVEELEYTLSHSYSTTTEVNAAIEQKIEESTASITSEISGNYVKIDSTTDEDGNEVGNLASTVEIYNTIQQFVSESESTILLQVSDVITLASEGIKSYTPYYAVTQSSTYYPSHGDDGTTAILGTAVLGKMILGNSAQWTTTQPTLSEGEYCWLAYYVVYNSGATEWTEPTLLTDTVARVELNTLTEQYAELSVSLNSISASVTQQITNLETEVTETIEANLVLEIATDSDGNKYGKISANADYIEVSAGQFIINSSNGGQFTFDADGNATFSGTLSAGTVTTTSISSGAVTASKIATGTITATQIASNTITATQIASNTITATQIASNTITAAQIASNTITASEIATGAITANEIASNTITASEIASGTITATELAASCVTTAKIAADAVTAAKIDVDELSAISADVGTLTAGVIQSTSYSTSKGVKIDLDNGTITSPSFSIDSSGNATFSGSLSAASGTFSGTLSSVGGTFTGTLSGASGSFSGSVSASSFSLSGASMTVSSQSISVFTISTSGTVSTSTKTKTAFTISSSYGLVVSGTTQCAELVATTACFSTGYCKSFVCNETYLTALTVPSSGTLTVNGSTGVATLTVSSTLTVTGTATFNGSLISNSTTTLSTTVTYGNLTVNDGDITCAGDVKYWGSCYSLSDERLKKDWISLDKYDAFFDALEPLGFHFINNADKYRLGMKAQDVEKALADNGLENSDFAGISISTTSEMSPNYGKYDEEYSLDYTQFIPLTIYEVQNNKTSIADLKKQIADLESRLAKYEQAVA